MSAERPRELVTMKTDKGESLEFHPAPVRNASRRRRQWCRGPEPVLDAAAHPRHAAHFLFPDDPSAAEAPEGNPEDAGRREKGRPCPHRERSVRYRRRREG